MADIQAKYQKLATEYAKIRSQLPVLKAAVVDGQKKEDHLKEGIKEKEKSIRKFEQEIDSLTFRNQQLSSRVTILQDELNDAQLKQRKNKQVNTSPAHEPVTNNSNSDVIGEELQNKIEENARLHKQVYEAEQKHSQTVFQLQDRLDVLEREKNQHEQILNNAVSKNKNQIEKLQNEKALLEVQLQKQDKDVKDAKTRAEQAESELHKIQNELTSKLDEATKVIKDKIAFNDTKNRDFNALNIPTHDRKHQLKTREIVTQAGSLVKEFVQSMMNFHAYTEQRSQIYPNDSSKEPLSAVNKKFCQYLHESASFLRPVQQKYVAFQESLKDDALTTLATATGLQDFASEYQRYVKYSNKILPYQLLSIDEECSLSSCSTTLEAKNRLLYQSLQALHASLDHVGTYVSLIAEQSKKGSDHPRCNHSAMFSKLSSAVTHLHEVIKDVSKHYNAKVTQEHQLPTATQKLKTTDECVVSSLVSLVACTGKFSTFLTNNIEFFSASVGYRTRGSSVSTDQSTDGPACNPAVSGFRQRAANYITSLNKPCPDSVPYKVAIQNRRTLFSSTESRESLAQQVSEFQDKVSQIEQEKEHWMLESQLLKIKHEKEVDKVAQLEQDYKKLQARLTGSIEDNLDVIPEAAKSPVSPGAPIQIDTSMLGRLDSGPRGRSSTSDMDSREQLIKDHFTQRIQQLTSQLQVADSKAVNFYAECRALHKRLNIEEKSKKKLQEEANAHSQTIIQLKDDLQTTTKSYESQLSMMSEHLAGMNEKLANQKDEIDSLRLQLNQKPVKKGKKK
ncbi:unnamed protein product [Owenia fusiformis]|uniref:Protein phosphatase 1 regulatory subunit 21 n=1 Tax=Owenia fusiformis TaxID=6347 RepID=A0A8S4PH72_OWEFU|nr:unnamed protein product [Owenia fusiformis]